MDSNVSESLCICGKPAVPGHTAQESSLDDAWVAAEKAVRENMPGRGFGVSADGPGYVAWVGGEERIYDAWSVDDPELVGDPDRPSSPAKALLKLVRLIEGVGSV